MTDDDRHDEHADRAPGPLHGIRILELAAIGPVPFCAMVLSDLGAEVIRIDRADAVPADPPAEPPRAFTNRGRRSVGVDLKHPDGVATVLSMVERADALLEGFRPGVAERLGLGPAECLARNPRLVYGRMTGWGQSGPLAQAAGHDINYIALSGALHGIGRDGERPVPPLNLVGDYGGGAMFLALGVCAAVISAARTGHGQVVDAAMVDGSALLTTLFHSLGARGLWDGQRGRNMLDTGAPFYDTYETADGGHVAVGAVEPQFYAELLARLGLSGEYDPADQLDRSRWPAQQKRFAEVFATKTRDEWCAELEGTDACFAPVLSFTEAAEHPHNRERGTFVEIAGSIQPGPAPRFSRTPSSVSRPPSRAGQDTDAVLADWGFPAEVIAELRAGGAVR